MCQSVVEAPTPDGSDTGKCNDCNGLQHPELTQLGAFLPYRRYLVEYTSFPNLAHEFLLSLQSPHNEVHSPLHPKMLPFSQINSQLIVPLVFQVVILLEVLFPRASEFNPYDGFCLHRPYNTIWTRTLACYYSHFRWKWPLFYRF